MYEGKDWKGIEEEIDNYLGISPSYCCLFNNNYYEYLWAV